MSGVGGSGYGSGIEIGGLGGKKTEMWVATTGDWQLGLPLGLNMHSKKIP